MIDYGVRRCRGLSTCDPGASRYRTPLEHQAADITLDRPWPTGRESPDGRDPKRKDPSIK